MPENASESRWELIWIPIWILIFVLVFFLVVVPLLPWDGRCLPAEGSTLRGNCSFLDVFGTVVAFLISLVLFAFVSIGVFIGLERIVDRFRKNEGN